MSQNEGKPAIVIDNGMGTCIAGLAGETTPACTLPTAMGYLPAKENTNERYLPVLPEAKDKPLSVGNTIKFRTYLNERVILMERGVIQDWDRIEEMWNHLYDCMGLKSNQHSVLITEKPLSPRSNREKTSEIFFEKFGAPAFHVVVDTVLALQGSGMRSALVLDCGEGVSSVGAMYEGCLIPKSVNRLDVAGTDVTTYLCHLLGQNGYKFTRTGSISISEREIVNTIKEKLGRIAEEPIAESGNRNEEEVYVLPDGTQLRIGNERYECGEPLFNPSVIGLDVAGIHKLVIDSINRCDVDTRRDLYKDIILVGGTTQMKGFEERLKHELRLLAPDNAKINITAPNNRQYTVWLGGALLASSATFQEMWISKKEYQEHGHNIVNKRCWACT
ncbi:hypothetical protein CHS0354_031237 [Potamilus streckersoni]|uniref:Actin n=1 Tax=Potamilus streckersoni TaxID=2493646 RepID=A0AAE0SBS1_9BIVA|nr:hypothetical protein CHS0354_031237 [Potamilus streckersoni]